MAGQSSQFIAVAAAIMVALVAQPLLAQSSGGDVIDLNPKAAGGPSSPARAPSVQFDMGVGYSSLSISGSHAAIDGEGLLRFEPCVGGSPFQQLPQLRIGVAVGVGLDFSNTSGVIASGDHGLIVAGSTDVPLWTLEPEFRLSWRQYFSQPYGLFVEPGVGVGFIYARLDLQDDNGRSFDSSDTALTGRAFLNVGMTQGPGSAGVQLSYMRGGSLNLADNVDGDVNEFYIGVFGEISY